jgi:hypothetical protein
MFVASVTIQSAPKQSRPAPKNQGKNGLPWSGPGGLWSIEYSFMTWVLLPRRWRSKLGSHMHIAATPPPSKELTLLYGFQRFATGGLKMTPDAARLGRNHRRRDVSTRGLFNVWKYSIDKCNFPRLPKPIMRYHPTDCFSSPPPFVCSPCTDNG